MLEDNTMLVDIEICWTKGNTRQRQTDTYIYQLYLGQLKRSKDYKNMKKIIQILIESYDYFKKDKLIYDVVFMEQNLHIVEDNFIHKYHINLDKVKNMSYNILKKKENKIERLLYFLICENDKMLKDIYKGDKFMEEVVKEAKEIAGYFDADLYLPEETITLSPSTLRETLSFGRLAINSAKSFAGTVIVPDFIIFAVTYSTVANSILVAINVR